MPSDQIELWREENQRYLMAALAEVRFALDRHAESNQGDEPPPEPPAWDHPAPPALEVVCQRFGLSPFERAVLLLGAGMELDSSFAARCAAAQGDPPRRFPPFSLALAALPEPHWSAVSPAGPLRYWRLVETAGGAGVTLTSSPLRIDERVLHYLAGLDPWDDRLAGTVRPLGDTPEPVPSHRALAERLASAFSPGVTGRSLPVVQLCGGDTAAKRSIAAAACAALGLRVQVLGGADLPTGPSELAELIRLWEREAALSGSALLVDADDLDGGDPSRDNALTRLADELRGVVLLAVRERRPVRERRLLAFDVPHPDRAEQGQLWRSALGAETAAKLDGQLDAVISQFQLGIGGILSAGSQLALSGGDSNGHALWDACRAQSRPRLEGLAQRIEPVAEWDDLVLPDAQKDVLREAAAQVRRRQVVYEDWGFAGRSARGLGVSALFAGPSGTGKTMAAEVLARELRLDLYRIDLSTVVSKYIGETEKNLRRVFDAADEGGAILLFDEADALFGKRSEVKDSHDRYANIEVSYLLQRMEAYRGLAILTTNLKDSLDQAFLRRLRFVVQFPFPDVEQRAEIWRRIFPQRTPVEGLDVEKLARLGVAGGTIRNIALSAAFLAADEGAPVRMAHLVRAARGEFVKLERSLTEAETRDWVD
ncbi:MAG: ATP-binding protein [Acidobacteriota bacterium]